MFRNLSSSITQPQDLRRRQQARRDPAFQHSSQWDSAGLSSEGWNGNGMLDLSMHHSNAPFSVSFFHLNHFLADNGACNRFDALAAPPPAVTRERVYQFSSPRRRVRNSRGTKEAKKRRDARRNRRKFDAQFLDEQLSRNIDETLTRANIPRPPPGNLLTLPPVFPTPFVSQWPTCTTLNRYAPAPLPQLPPQLPQLNFSRLGLRDFPHLPTPRQSPSISPPPPVCKGVPSWCPQIPSRMQDGIWSDNLPKFWDLSSLAEPKRPQPKEEKCQDLQLWKGALNLQPKRQQSRFFPPATTPKLVVKLPPTSYKLHWSEAVSQDPVTTAWTAPAATPDPVMSAVEKIVAAVQADTLSEHSINDPPSAANLWHILASALDDTRETHRTNNTSNWDDDAQDTGGVPLHPVYTIYSNEDTPAELEDSSVPYVHGNSLTGHANGTAAYHANYDSEEQLLHDSAVHLVELFAPVRSSPIDSASPAYELAAMPWPLTPRVATPPPTYDSVAAFPPSDNGFAETNTDSDDLAHSTDHFKSEQQLFDPAEIALPKSPAESQCDLESFLSMGHVENCWCRDCDDAPVMINAEPVTPFTEVDDDDGWAAWSSAESNTSSTDTPTLIEAESPHEDNDHPSYAVDWDDFFPQYASCPQEPEQAFLGYYDDRLAFAKKEEKEEDHDWMWNF